MDVDLFVLFHPGGGRREAREDLIEEGIMKRREGILICRPVPLPIPLPIPILSNILNHHPSTTLMLVKEEEDDNDPHPNPNPPSNFAFQHKAHQVVEPMSQESADESSKYINDNASSSVSVSVSVLGRRLLIMPMPIKKNKMQMLPFASISSSSSSCVEHVNEGTHSVQDKMEVKKENEKTGKGRINNGPIPSIQQLSKHPLALLAMVPDALALFTAGAIAGAAAKTLTAPLDRIKLLMQTHGLRAAASGTNMGIGFIQAITLIRMEEGVKGYWKGNLPQVIRIIPYSAVQLFAYEVYKKLFKKKDELSVIGRLAAGACAGMTSTFVTYPLDVLRLRLAVETGNITMSQVAFNMLREEGIASFYSGLGPSLLGIAPYIAVNFCIFDLVKKSLPEKYQKRTETSIVTALMSATLATLMCYPLDTVRRQMQMKGSPYNTVFDAFPGILERDGFLGLYRGFVPNALKNLPNSSIRLTTFDTVKGLIKAGQKELQNIMEENQDKL